MKRKPKGNAPDPGVAAWRRQVNRAWTLGRGNLVAKVKINAGATDAGYADAAAKLAALLDGGTTRQPGDGGAAAVDAPRRAGQVGSRYEGE